MRLHIKRRPAQPKTPEQIERAYRQMLTEQDFEKRKAHWFNIHIQTPGN